MDVSQRDEGGSWLWAVLSHIREGVIGLDAAGRVAWMNHAAERWTGKRQQRIKGQGVDALFDIPNPSVSDALFAAMEQAVVLGPYPVSLASNSGRVRVDCTIAPVAKGDDAGGAVMVLSEHAPGYETYAPAGEALRGGLSEGKKRVLVMDDDEVVRTLTVQKLVRLGHNGQGTSSGDEAVSKYREAMGEGKPFDVVILDLIVKDGMGGRETIEILRSIDPDVKAVLTSGNAVDPVLTNYWEYGFGAVVRKPFVIKELEVAIREALREE